MKILGSQNGCIDGENYK